MRLAALFAASFVLLTTSCDKPLEETATLDRQVENPFPNATEVRLFVEVNYSDSGQAILNNPNGVALSVPQRDEFENALSITAAPDDMYMCFIPHHFFRYYAANGEEIGEVEVCFCCEGVTVSGSENLRPMQGEIVGADYATIQRLVAAVGEPTDVFCD